MNTKRGLFWMPLAALCLLLTSCFDSTAPLSDPKTAKPDDRLLGVWRFKGESGEVNYYHFGRMGDKLPPALMRVVNVHHAADGKLRQADLLLSPTTLGDKTYFSLAEMKPPQLVRLEETGWTTEAVRGYLILRYQISGDAMTIQWIDGEAKRKAIEAGKIKGVIQKDRNGATPVHFTDTTENVAKFVAKEGDALFSKDVLRLERVK